MEEKRNNPVNPMDYGNNDDVMTILREEESYRSRPGVIFGTNDERGAAHGVYEIIANAIDEAREGFGKQIRLTIHTDDSLEVSDDGRGVPMGWNEKYQKYNWEIVFCTPFGSGKMDSKNYNQSLGLNGLGATAMQYTSAYMDVTSVRGGKTYIKHFIRGKSSGDLEVKDTPDASSGTTIRFKPDDEVFTCTTGIVTSMEYYAGLLRKQAMLHPGVEFIIKDEKSNTQVVLRYDDGIKEFINTFCKSPMLKDTLYFEDTALVRNSSNSPEFTLNMRFAINFSRETPLSELYHNGSHLTEGGVTSDAFKSGVTKAFEDVAKQFGKLNRGDRLLFRDIESVLVIVVDTNAPGHETFFKNQTKEAIINEVFKQPVGQFVYGCVRRWAEADRVQSDRVIEQILLNKQAREEADKVTRKVVQSISKGISGIGNKPEKFTNCRSKDPARREVYIVEGDSAKGACVLSRDAEFQAIMPIRGKILNCLKADITRVMNSDIIVDLLRIIGCGVEVQPKNGDIQLPKFDINKFLWNKVIICTDADIDGMQIRCLLLTMIYRLCPTLIKMGKVYIAETPLFEITAGKETYFAYTQQEKDQLMKKLENMGFKDGQIKVQRSKGLGENDADMMSKSTMNPETRRLIQVEYPDDDSNTANVFNALLGDDIESRKMFITEYFRITNEDDLAVD